MKIIVVERVSGGYLYEHKILIDDDIFPMACKYTWSMTGGRTPYAVTRVGKGHMCLHHFVNGFPIKPLVTDHKDNNSDNCQKDNLATVTVRQNNQNKCAGEGSLPGAFLMYTQGPRVKPWLSQIVVEGKSVYLGYFKTKSEAFFVYKAAVEDLGEFITPWVLEKCYK